ncbi:MAG: hypothetical protein KC983_01385 [Phycisphaerales bacterium]|nr:hypothetical protein [Phycisphaerales bacterium]
MLETALKRHGWTCACEVETLIAIARSGDPYVSVRALAAIREVASITRNAAGECHFSSEGAPGTRHEGS